jgi:hypothetical protein
VNILLFLPSIFVFAVYGSMAFAQSNRMAILADSYIMEHYSKYLGDCKTEVLDYTIELKCQNDDENNRVLIEVLTSYDPGSFGTPRQKYLADRKAYCFNLVSNRNGRCIGTDRISPRSRLAGFRSKSSENPNLRRVEIVLFHGSELLRSTVITKRHDIGADLDNLLQWSLIRLTPYW